MRVPPQLAGAFTVLIVGGVFTVGLFTDWLGLYSDVLHLIILSGVLTFTMLAFVFVYGRGRRRGISRTPSRPWQLVIAFFEGSAVSLIAYDLSDYVYYWASAKGALDATQQAFYFAVFPTLLYIGLAVGSYYLAISGRIKPEFFLYFFLILIVATPTITGLFLPQASDIFYVLTITLGGVVSGLITLALIRQVRRARR